MALERTGSDDNSYRAKSFQNLYQLTTAPLQELTQAAIFLS
jgi:hypothetical protein